MFLLAVSLLSLLALFLAAGFLLPEFMLSSSSALESAGVAGRCLGACVGLFGVVVLPPAWLFVPERVLVDCAVLERVVGDDGFAVRGSFVAATAAALVAGGFGGAFRFAAGVNAGGVGAPLACFGSANVDAAAAAAAAVALDEVDVAPDLARGNGICGRARAGLVVAVLVLGACCLRLGARAVVDALAAAAWRAVLGRLDADVGVAGFC